MEYYQKQEQNTWSGEEIFVRYEGRREIVIADMTVTFDTAQWAASGDPAIGKDWIGISFAIFKDLLTVAAGATLRWPEMDTMHVLRCHLHQFPERVVGGRGFRNPVTSNFQLIEADEFAAMREAAEKAEWDESCRVAGEAEAAYTGAAS